MRSNCNTAVIPLVEQVLQISNKIDSLSSVLRPTEPVEVVNGMSPNMLTSLLLPLVTKITEMSERLDSLGTVEHIVPQPTPSAPEECSSSTTYPAPNEATSDGGIWMEIASTRHWVKDLATLRALKTRHMNKQRRRERRAQKRREVRQQKRNESRPNMSQSTERPRASNVGLNIGQQIQRHDRPLEP